MLRPSWTTFSLKCGGSPRERGNPAGPFATHSLPGLRPFEAADQPVFFGRESQISAILRQLEDHRFVAVVGSSGSGKSSLVRAGLLPALREGFLFGATDWVISIIKPGNAPYDPENRIWVVLTMRSDFIGNCEAFLGLPEAVSRSQFLVPRLDRKQMEEAITRPGEVKIAAFQPFSFQQDLVNRIVNDAGDRPDQLPMMQHRRSGTDRA